MCRLVCTFVVGMQQNLNVSRRGLLLRTRTAEMIEPPSLVEHLNTVPKYPPPPTHTHFSSRKDNDYIKSRDPKVVLFNSGKFFHAFLLSADFCQNQLFRKVLSGIPSECQTDWIKIRSDVLSSLIVVQTVCKSYQQTTVNVSYSIHRKGNYSYPLWL